MPHYKAWARHPPAAPLSTRLSLSQSNTSMAPIDFRRIDVDQYDEDRLDPETLYHPDPRSPAQVLAAVQETDKLVRTAVQRGDLAGALQAALDTQNACPYGQDSIREISQAKVSPRPYPELFACGTDSSPSPQATALATVLTILNSTRLSDIPDLVTPLSPDQQLWLMKYLYKAMENLGDTSGNVVLGWHEKVGRALGVLFF
jgi:actin related protein 2/3 complex subunit 5